MGKKPLIIDMRGTLGDPIVAEVQPPEPPPREPFRLVFPHIRINILPDIDKEEEPDYTVHLLVLGLGWTTAGMVVIRNFTPWIGVLMSCVGLAHLGIVLWKNARDFRRSNK